jgi:type II restriction enzyme
MKSIMHDEFPSLILLHYDPFRWNVANLYVIHRACITSSCIIPRRPLRPTARRAGWQGCLISLNDVPDIGHIDVVRNGVVTSRDRVLSRWRESEKLLKVEPKIRGWLADVLRCVERLFPTFTLDNVYSFEEELTIKHPNNRNVRAKIRQQLQVLRDLGLIEFIDRGVYRRTGVTHHPRE